MGYSFYVGRETEMSLEDKARIIGAIAELEVSQSDFALYDVWCELAAQARILERELCVENQSDLPSFQMYLAKKQNPQMDAIGALICGERALRLGNHFGEDLVFTKHHADWQAERSHNPEFVWDLLEQRFDAETAKTLIAEGFTYIYWD